VDSLRVGFDSDSSSLGLPYNEGAPHVVTYDDLIAIGAQEEPMTKADDVVVSWGGAPVVMPHRCWHWSMNCITKSRYRHRAMIACPAYDDNRAFYKNSKTQNLITFKKT
jgi:hypothetical protein